MRQAAAKKGDRILPTTPHMHKVSLSVPPSPLLLPHPCTWDITENLSTNVNIEGQPAAMVDSGGRNSGAQAHQLIPPETAFVTPLKNMNQARISSGSGSVNINRRPAARQGSDVETCDEGAAGSTGTVLVAGACKVWIGD